MDDFKAGWRATHRRTLWDVYEEIWDEARSEEAQDHRVLFDARAADLDWARSEKAKHRGARRKEW